MSKSHWNGSSTGYADDVDDRGPRRYAPRSATTALYDDAPEYRPDYTRGDDDTSDLREPLDYAEYDDPEFLDADYQADYDEDHPSGGYDGFAGDGYYYSTDTRWRWVAIGAGVVLLVAVIAIAMALQSGDSSTATTTPTPGDDAVATSSQAAATSAPAVSAPPKATVSATRAPGGGLPPETVVTVPPSVSAHQNPDTPAIAGEPADPATAPERTITYTVTGDRQLFDLVTVIYTDEQGFPRTDINVALPWTRTVVLNPGVNLKSVTATSVAGKLNCAISNGSGDLLVQQNAGTILAACTN
ncbi:MAG: hypothetical protein U0R77_15535 [Mycolicibacterium insubricum]|nr:hypothetical protein [Mycobacterium sp.]